MQAALRREEILKVALALFAEHGYAATSTRRIAKAAGVTEGLVFHYFSTKEALLLEIAARQHTFAGRVVTLLHGGTDATARELLHAVAEGLTAVSSDELAFISFMQAESQLNPQLRSMVATATATVLSEVVRFLQDRVTKGEVRVDASLSAAAHGFFGGFFFFFTQHRHLEPAAWRREASQFGSAWAEQCWRGIAVAPDGTTQSGKNRRRSA